MRHNPRGIESIGPLGLHRDWLADRLLQLGRQSCHAVFGQQAGLFRIDVTAATLSELWFSILIGLVESGQWRRRFEARPEEDRHLDWAAWTRRLAAQKHIPLGRLGLPEEAARAILFLASPLSSYTTGSHIDISGGHSRHA